MGTARDWQAEVEEYYADTGVVLVNPRRDDWDPTWEQKVENPHFYQQVKWEMNAIAASDAVLFVFEPGTKSPISIGELYMCAATRPDEIVVVCPDGFWRKGNIDIVLEHFGARPAVDRLSDAYRELERIIRAKRVHK